MAKKPNITTVTTGYQATDTINDNFQNIRNAFDNTLSRDGSLPNHMDADLDMDSNDILNVNTLSVNGLYIDGLPVTPSAIQYNGVTKETQVATSGQTVFNLTSITYTPGINNLSVYVDGVYQNPSTYSETNATRVTFSVGLHVGAIVDFVVLTINALPGTTDAVNVTYTPQGVGAVSTTVSNKLKESVSVKDFGAVGDDNTDNLNAFKNALQYLESIGGGSLYVPAGIYRVSEPIIIRSDIELFGDGAASEIKNSVGQYTNAGDVIHIGISSEWVNWGNSGSAVTDASLTQFDAADYSKLNTKNVHIHNIHVSSSAASGTQGLGIWAVNAENFIIENIWSTNVATPVNVANDSNVSPMGCRNGLIKNIFQLTGGRWYDLVYIGECENIEVSNCFTNPASASTLNAAIAIGATARYINVHNNFIQFDTAGSKIGIEITGPVSIATEPNNIHNNIFVNVFYGVVLYQFANQVVHDNIFKSCNEAIRIYETGHTISNNTFQNCTYDLSFRSGASATFTDMVLSISRITEQSPNILNNSTFRNCIGFGGTRAKVYWGTDYVIGAEDVSKVTAQGAIVTFTGGSTAQMYVRLPDNLLTLQEVTTYWYANASGEVINLSLFKRETFGNFNGWVQVGSTQTYTSSSAADQTSTWSSINATVTNVETSQTDQYYLRIEVIFADASSQLRATRATYRTFGSNE